jgi:hypothetical protein
VSLPPPSDNLTALQPKLRPPAIDLSIGRPFGLGLQGNLLVAVSSIGRLAARSVIGCLRFPCAVDQRTNLFNPPDRGLRG